VPHCVTDQAVTEHTELLPDPLPAEPLVVVARWLADAWAAGRQPNANSMVLATASRDGRPSARVVLCKDIVPQPGYLVFYTNYHSSKGRELQDNPRAAAVMHWDALQRQVRIEGPITQGAEQDSDKYFASRAWQSRIGAWASEQSEPLASRRRLLDAVKDAARRFGTPVPGTPAADAASDFEIPRPPHWGGLRLWAESVELWVAGDARIHDRARWTRTLGVADRGGFTPGAWQVTRLQP
jgi:pyridoxamine 5'-phosphate oxidase